MMYGTRYNYVLVCEPFLCSFHLYNDLCNCKPEQESCSDLDFVN